MNRIDSNSESACGRRKRKCVKNVLYQKNDYDSSNEDLHLYLSDSGSDKDWSESEKNIQESSSEESEGECSAPTIGMRNKKQSLLTPASSSSPPTTAQSSFSPSASTSFFNPSNPPSNFPASSEADAQPRDQVVSAKKHSSNHFTVEEDKFLKELFIKDLKELKVVPIDYMQSQLFRTGFGRKLYQKFGSYKIKNKLNYYKRQLNKSK